MIVRFFNTGTSNGEVPVRYLLSTTDHEGNQRPHAPEILEGSPALTIDIINSIERKHKYASGCIAFRPNEQPTRQQLLGIVDAFKAVVARDLLSPSRGQWRHSHVQSHQADGPRTGNTQSQVQQTEYVRQSPFGGPNGRGRTTGGRKPVASTGAAINTAATLDEKIRALTIELNDFALGSLEARAITDELNRLQGERGRLPQEPAPTKRLKPR